MISEGYVWHGRGSVQVQEQDLEQDLTQDPGAGAGAGACRRKKIVDIAHLCLISFFSSLILSISLLYKYMTFVAGIQLISYGDVQRRDGLYIVIIVVFLVLQVRLLPTPLPYKPLPLLHLTVEAKSASKQYPPASIIQSS